MYLQPLTPRPWVALIQPLGQDILGTAAQDVHAVLEVYVILTLHFIDFNFGVSQSAVGAKHAAKKKSSNPGGCIFILFQAGPFSQRGGGRGCSFCKIRPPTRNQIQDKAQVRSERCENIFAWCSLAAKPLSVDRILLLLPLNQCRLFLSFCSFFFFKHTSRAPH